MQCLIIQEAGEHPENAQFRESLSLQRALNSFGEFDVDVWGKGYQNFNRTPDFDLYDLIVNLENYHLDWIPFLREVNKPVKFLWSIDAHVRGIQPYIETFQEENYDLILQATEDFVQDENSVWFPNCYDDSLIIPYVGTNQPTDIGFCGSRLNRGELLDFLTQEVGLKQDIWVLGHDMVKTIKSYWIHFNQNIGNDINYRSFETLGCGTVLLTNWNLQYHKLGFVDEYNCLMYKNRLDLLNKINKYYGKYNELDKIRKRGISLGKNHTYYERAKKLIELYHVYKVKKRP